ncbi:MAG: helix-turn-helix domain-containing protein [Candidatus Colwellbacteria bacterium]
MKLKSKNNLEGEAYHNITAILQEAMETKGLDAGKLADLTDVPQRFISLLVSGDFDSLPSEPYIRGYLFKIAGVLEADPNFLWRSFRQSAEIHSSGSGDILPANRFGLKKVSSRKIWIILVAIAVLIFLGFRINSILGKPTLEVSLPETTASQIINVTGQATPGDTLTLNDEVIYPYEDGRFTKEVQLVSGPNLLKFKVKRYLGRETTVDKQVFYQPQ